MSIGFKIKKLRENRGLSQPRLADMLGISQSELSKIENDQVKKIDFLFMDKICKEFDVDFYYFSEENQYSISNIQSNNGSVVGFNHGTINVCPENLIAVIKSVFEENAYLKTQNKNLSRD